MPKRRACPRDILRLAIIPAMLAAAPVFAQTQAEPEQDLREALEPADPTLPSDIQRSPIPEPEAAARPPSRTEPNFGKPRARPDPRLGYAGRPKQARRTLPTPQPYVTAPRDLRRTYVEPQAPPPPTPYAEPRQPPQPLRPKLEANPYAPTGVTVGALRLYPYVETGIGQDSNATRSPTIPKPSLFTRLEGGFRLQSDWSRHELKADVSGAWLKFFDVNNADRPEGAAKANLRLDALRDTKVDFELRGTITTQRPGSPEVNAVLTGRPAIFSYGGTAGVTQNFGRLEVTLATLLDRTTYQNGQLSNGNIVALDVNDYTQTGLRGRIGYELTPGVKPFVEVTGDMRRRDLPVDAAGFQRNSTGLQARAGSTFELTRTLTGEVSAGYIDRKYEDARLPELRGPAIDASLVWTATPLTTVTLRATTTANETTQLNSSGYITRRTTLEVNHALLRNLNIIGQATYQNDKYRGIAVSQDLMTGTLKAEYALTRSIVVKGSFTHERLKSSVPGSDYTANIYLLGLRLQR